MIVEKEIEIDNIAAAASRTRHGCMDPRFAFDDHIEDLSLEAGRQILDPLHSVGPATEADPFPPKNDRSC